MKSVDACGRPRLFVATRRLRKSFSYLNTKSMTVYPSKCEDDHVPNSELSQPPCYGSAEWSVQCKTPTLVVEHDAMLIALSQDSLTSQKTEQS